MFEFIYTQERERAILFASSYIEARGGGGGGLFFNI